MKISLKFSENLHFIAKARRFNDIHIDEPESFHGTDLGPSSVEYVLIGIGGCLGSSFIYCLQKKKIEIENLEIEIDGKLKHTGPKMNLRLVNVDVQLIFTPKKGKQLEIINQCIKKFFDYCVVSNSIIQGIPINVSVSQKNRIE